MKKKGTNTVLVDSAGAGDIVSMAGLANPAIGHTIASVQVHKILCFCHFTGHNYSLSFFDVIIDLITGDFEITYILHDLFGVLRIYVKLVIEVFSYLAGNDCSAHC